MKLVPTVLLGLFLSVSSLRATDPPTKTIAFGRDVQPILARSCLSCHGAEKQRGGLRLDSRKAALRGGNSGVVLKPGDSASSRLLVLAAGLDKDLRMPPEGKPALTAAELALLRAWIDQGLKWDETDVTTTESPRSKHWAFQPIAPPTRNSMDAFVLARLEKENVKPSPEADRVTLIRRLSLDLLGLPPTPAEVDAFRNDTRPDAYERLVDRLLGSPHYGERWGRHWLDLARYADSDGFEKDTGRPYAYRYRDWVIDALNRDLGYDQFAIEQLAGDLLPQATTQQKMATGFHRNTLTNKEGGVDQEQYRVEQVVDRVNTTARVFLGLTLGCAQCHDHKYDPISQREYYQFLAFFNSDVEVNLPAPGPNEEALLEKERAVHEARLKELQATVEAYRKTLPDKPNAKEEARLAALTKAVTEHQKKPPTGTQAQTLALGRHRKTHVMIRGDFLRKGVEVESGTPACLPLLRLSVADASASLFVVPPLGGLEKEDRLKAVLRTPNRLDLARWLVRPDNSLTARVAVNWVWQKYFGRGLVYTLEDFGTQGEKPSHPELLDYLATELQRQKWSLKALHRLIVTSATYRQSSRSRPELLQRDPTNVLLARQARLRLEAEIIRDVTLAASGLLTPTIGGPSIRPPQPPGVSELTYAGSARWVESTGSDRYRRGLYVWFQRTSPFPMLITFDAPDSNVCSVRRERTNTPLQALTLLNDIVFVEAAQALAQRIVTEKTGTTTERLQYAFRLCVARQPTPSELKRLLRLFDDLHELLRGKPEESRKLLGKSKIDAVPVSEAATWVALARALLNLDEFVTRE